MQKIYDEPVTFATNVILASRFKGLLVNEEGYIDHLFDQPDGFLVEVKTISDVIFLQFCCSLQELIEINEDEFQDRRRGKLSW